MNKNALYLVVFCALAVTALTFFMSGHGSQTCTTQVFSEEEDHLYGRPVTTTSKTIHATVRGYPYRYYQDPFPADTVCVPTGGAASLSGFNMNHLGSDLLIWLLASLAVAFGAAGFKAWRGPRMLGDYRRHA